MGFGLPAAIGVQFGCPNELVWVVSGDGGFQMTMCELSTVAKEQLPIKIAIFNNGYLGMVRQWQDVFYNSVMRERHCTTQTSSRLQTRMASGLCVTDKAGVAPAIRQAWTTMVPS